MTHMNFEAKHRGAVLVAALVVLLVVMLIGAALARALAIHRRQAQGALQRQQAFWFAESALQRAVTRVRASADYTGETWHATLEIDHEPQRGVAEIKVLPVAGESRRRSILVEVRWPDAPLDRILEQRQLVIELSATGVPS